MTWCERRVSILKKKKVEMKKVKAVKVTALPQEASCPGKRTSCK